jgi:hypothetical protein
VLHNIRVDYEFEDWLDIAVYIRTDKFLGTGKLQSGQPIPKSSPSRPNILHYLDGSEVALESYADW